MQPLKKRLESLRQKLVQIQQLEEILAQPEAWNDPAKSTAQSKQLADLKTITEPWQNLIDQVAGLEDMLTIADDTMLGEIETQTETLEAEYEVRRKDLLFDGPYDDHGAVLRLSAGAGGVDAMDWTAMLLRMYTRWAEK